MILLRYSQTLIEANCYILADSDQRQALVVDPGAGAAQWVKATLQTRGLELAAVLCTHGHSDHVWDAALVAGDAPVYIPEPDMYRLDDPTSTSAAYAGAFVTFSGHEWERPQVCLRAPAAMFEGGGMELVPGIWLRAVPAPGHTEGSTVFLFSGSIDEDREAPGIPEWAGGTALMLTGDVLFNNGVGRTDLPGGDPRAAAESLRTLVQVIDPATIFFPGHGPSSTMGREIKHSCYLRQAMAAGE